MSNLFRLCHKVKHVNTEPKVVIILWNFLTSLNHLRSLWAILNGMSKFVTSSLLNVRYFILSVLVLWRSIKSVLSTRRFNCFPFCWKLPLDLWKLILQEKVVLKLFPAECLSSWTVYTIVARAHFKSSFFDDKQLSQTQAGILHTRTFLILLIIYTLVYCSIFCPLIHATVFCQLHSLVEEINLLDQFFILLFSTFRGYKTWI